MTRQIVVAALVAACFIMPAHAASDAECQEMWKKADVNNDGVLSDLEAQRYTAAMRIAEKRLPPNATLDKAAFLDACKTDVFLPRKADAGAPLKGANSFTENQAKDRAVAHGMANVSGLKKDDDGIWRGTAMQEGKQVQIAVDYKGNVVAMQQ